MENTTYKNIILEFKRMLKEFEMKKSEFNDESVFTAKLLQKCFELDKWKIQQVKKHKLEEEHILEELLEHECFYTFDVSSVSDLLEEYYTLSEVQSVFEKYKNQFVKWSD